MKRWLVGILLLSALAISGVLYWQSKSKDFRQTSIAKEEALPSDIPPLFPQVSWKEFKESEGYKSLGEQGLYSQGDVFGSIRMNGQEWEGSRSNLDRASMDKLLASFRAYYDNELTKLGWSTNYEEGTYNFSPSAADGPGGSIWGYVKVNDGKLREVLLQQITPIEDFGGVAACPCRVGFRLFVSEATSLEELLKRVKE